MTQALPFLLVINNEDFSSPNDWPYATKGPFSMKKAFKHESHKSEVGEKRVDIKIRIKSFVQNLLLGDDFHSTKSSSLEITSGTTQLPF